MKLLNYILEDYIRDEMKKYKKAKDKFEDKYKNQICNDVIKVFTELNKIVKSPFNRLTQKEVQFKSIVGNSTKKELIFTIVINGKDKEVVTDYKDITEVIKKIKSATGINIIELNDIIEKNKNLLIFLDLEEILESVISYTNTFMKIECEIV